MADFSNFELGQNVTELADGLLPEMAEIFEVSLSTQPTIVELGTLVGALGTNKVLQENIDQVQEKLRTEQDALGVAASWLGRSGVQKALQDRSLWTPSITAPEDTVTVITGAVANWQDRVANLVAANTRRGEVYVPVGNRAMDTVTEKPNPHIAQYFEAEGVYPTEAEYVKHFVKPALEAADHEVTVKAYPTGNGEEIAAKFIEDYGHIFNGPVRFARVANAGIQLAGQFVRAARKAGNNFDTQATNPDAFVLTDEFPIAQTSKQQANPKEFQNPFTGIRQIAVTAKEIVSLTS